MEENKTWKIYKHTNKINGKVYIGQTCTSVEARWRNGDGYMNSPHFWSAICKYGWDNFNHEVLYDNLTQDEANQLEFDLIQLYDSTNREKGYNIRLGGNNSSFSEEAINKMIASRTGLHPNEATRLRMKKAHTGVHPSADTRNKLREGKLGEKNPFYGKHHTKEALEKIGQRFRKSVLCIEQNKKYQSTKEAGKMNGIDPSQIAKCCRGTRKTAGKLHWIYVDND